MSDAIRPTAPTTLDLTLGALLGDNADYSHADPTLRVCEPVLDSRKARAGDVFFALSGSKADGMAFANDALARGAVAVVGEAERPEGLEAGVPYVRVGNARRAV
ncbi:MAG TPA: Mur ligase domain-containing protein, partial [Ancylobacter sp.]